MRAASGPRRRRLGHAARPPAAPRVRRTGAPSRLSMVARRADVPLKTVLREWGRIGVDRLRRPAGAHRAAARARGGAARLDPGARVRGRQRRLPAAARPGLDADVDLLRAPRRPATPARSPAGSRSSCPGCVADARDRGGRAAGRPAGVGAGLRRRGGRGGRRRRRAGRAPARRGELRAAARAAGSRARSSTPLLGAAATVTRRPVRRARAARVRADRAGAAPRRPRRRARLAARRCRSRSRAPPRCPRSPGRR